MLSDLHYWLALSFCQDIGPRTTARLLTHFKDIRTIFQTTPMELQPFKLSEEALAGIANPDWKAVEEALKWQEQPDRHIIHWAHEAYPKLLTEIQCAPPLLYIHGQLSTLKTLKIAIVGSRHPTLSGKETAFKFAYKLAQAGLTVVSGIAQGIDGSAHQGALKALGNTLAVLGTGLLNIYPRSHRKLAETIASQGALISEFPLNTLPQAKNFPIRNRIISGLSLGTLVVEANVRSGSLITARYANEQGREIFAIPGSINNPLTKGCHTLIQQGAKLAQAVEDILQELNLPHSTVEIPPSNLHIDSKKLDNQQQKLVKCLDYEATAIDLIVERSGLSVSEISALLLTLELQGYIKSTAGGYLRT